MIEVKNLTKKYGNNTAVKNLNFTIKPGRIYGLLGQNGAGKSTTMNIITGCLAATSGSVTVNGHDIFEEPLAAKRCIGYLPELPPLYTDMTPEEYLMFVAEAKGMAYETAYKQVKEVMKLTQIESVSNRLIQNLSKGYKQRVGIAQAMLGNPDIIILDEPTVGLDPKQIIEIRELISKLGRIKTVIISSHILAEINEVCDHVLIISRGRLVADDRIADLEDKVNRTHTLHLLMRCDADAAETKLKSIHGVMNVATLKNPDGLAEFNLTVDKNCDIRDEVYKYSVASGSTILGMNLIRLTLEDIFLRLTDETNLPDDEITYGSGDESDKEGRGE